MEKKYKYIHIKRVGAETYNNHPVYRIFNNRSKSQIGIISWYVPWKEYVFSSQPECVFNNSCLMDVLDFIDNVIPAKLRPAQPETKSKL